MSWPKPDKNHLLVTAAEMKALEDEMFSSGLPVASLMEKAGHEIFSWLNDHESLLRNGVLVLVGPGHNGGDGLVVARELYLKGVKVKLWCPFPIKRSLTKQYLSHLEWLGVEIVNHWPDPYGNELWIEALFGLGQKRKLPLDLAVLFESRERESPGKLISLDVPAGICSDNGSFGNLAAVASTTLTLGLYKRGLIQDTALPHVGEIVLLDIGIPDSILGELSQKSPRRISQEDLKTISFPSPHQGAMKYERGRTLVIAGSSKYKGAANLALKGAVASGAGVIQAIVPKSLADGIWKVLPEVVLLDSLCERKIERNDSEVQKSNETFRRLDSILFGPGLGSYKYNWENFSENLRVFPGLLVLDADGINLLANSTEGWRWLKSRDGPTWLTPHYSEFSRLFPDLNALDPLEAAIKAARISGSVFLLKGAHSLVADPKGSVWQMGKTTPVAARAGFGDLLAGFVAGVGSLELASNKTCKSELLAIAMFLHSESARIEKKGSNPSLLSSTLAELTRFVQDLNCAERDMKMC